MAQTRLSAPSRVPVPPGTLYARWRSTPQHQLTNLLSDTLAWHVVPIDVLELLVFDQCIIFGAVCPHAGEAVNQIARRDAVVMQTRKTLWAIYACAVERIGRDQRLTLMHEVALAVECGPGSAGSLVAFIKCDPDASIRAAASARVGALREAALPELEAGYN
jgi:hypothetical protein